MSSEHGCADDVVNWTVLKSIQEANATSMRTMEECLLLVTRPDAVGSAERTLDLLERSITQHERVIEHLELAVSEIERDATTERGSDAPTGIEPSGSHGSGRSPGSDASGR